MKNRIGPFLFIAVAFAIFFHGVTVANDFANTNISFATDLSVIQMGQYTENNYEFRDYTAKIVIKSLPAGIKEDINNNLSGWSEWEPISVEKDGKKHLEFAKSNKIYKQKKGSDTQIMHFNSKTGQMEYGVVPDAYITSLSDLGDCGVASHKKKHTIKAEWNEQLGRGIIHIDGQAWYPATISLKKGVSKEGIEVQGGDSIIGFGKQTGVFDASVMIPIYKKLIALGSVDLLARYDNLLQSDR